jgi:hypothetical protein
LASIAGPAMVNTRRLVTAKASGKFQRPRGALTNRMMSQIGMTMMAPSRK